jgi:hypothetical protein
MENRSEPTVPVNPSSAPAQPLSASQLGLNQPLSPSRPKVFRQGMLLLIPLVLLAGLLGYRHFVSGFGKKRVVTDDVSYTVMYSRNAQQLIIGSTVYLEGTDPATGMAILLSVGHARQSNYDCQSSSTSRIVAKPLIDGQSHSLCYSRTLNLYAMNFKHRDEWYFLTVFPKDKDSRGKIDEQTAKKIAASVQIQ